MQQSAESAALNFSRKPVDVTFYGLLPTVYNLCAPCCRTLNFEAMACDSESASSEVQISEYGREIVQNNRKVSSLLDDLIRLLGDGFRLRVVDAASPRGLLCALRYRLGNGPCVIVRGYVLRGNDISATNIARLAGSDFVNAQTATV